jgi:hypothetical protein
VVVYVCIFFVSLSRLVFTALGSRFCSSELWRLLFGCIVLEVSKDLVHLFPWSSSPRRVPEAGTKCSLCKSRWWGWPNESVGGRPIQVIVSGAYVYWLLEAEGTANFRNVGKYITNNTASYCNTAVRSTNVAMDGMSRPGRTEVMSVKVRSSIRHKSDYRSYACVYILCPNKG